MSTHHHHHAAGNSLKIAFLLNLAFTVLEIFGGLYTNSIAVLADALHDSGDCLSLGLAWLLQNLSSKAADHRYTYGYRRLSMMGALITGVVLVVGLVFVFKSVIHRFQEPQAIIAEGVVLLAILGVAFNGFAVWKLSGGHSLNERVARWHLLEDTLGWGAVLIGSLVMLVWNLPIIDPLLSVLISSFILWNVGINLKKLIAGFLQATPEGFKMGEVRESILALDHVVNEHHTHIWTLDGEHHVFSTHLVLEKACSRAQILEAKKAIYALLFEKGFEHLAVEIELEGEDCFLAPSSDA